MTLLLTLRLTSVTFTGTRAEMSFSLSKAYRKLTGFCFISMNIGEKKNAKGDKIYYFYDLGRGRGQRPSTGIFIYTLPKTQEQKNHNRESLKILTVKKANAIIEKQSIGTEYIPDHKFKANFLDFYNEYVEKNKKANNRHLENSFRQFKLFMKKPLLRPWRLRSSCANASETFCWGSLQGKHHWVTIAGLKRL